ncbi:MAG: F0F1 ATP synthase subunit epsilon [Bacteroidales bacterium]|nr:F0F1 ATP synthase subunit epsilon [Bacteroidales bacterium]
MTLRIISPVDIVFEGTVDSVTLPGTMGSFTVLPRHAALVSTLTAGDITYRVGEEESRVHTDGGLVDVLDDVVSVCIY